MTRVVDRKLRRDEEFVICAVASHFSGEWWPGEDPPDAYLKMANEVVAVEISTLTQQVRLAKGGSIPRLSEDATGLWLADKLNEELYSQIPDGCIVILDVESPILKARRVTNQLNKIILRLVSKIQEGEQEVETEVLGNRLTIHVRQFDDPNRRKIYGVVSNSKSDPDILSNARAILADRIVAKSSKCQALDFKGAFWLLLFNDYWLAENETFQRALEMDSVNHPFARILLVSASKSVFVLFEQHR